MTEICHPQMDSNKFEFLLAAMPAVIGRYSCCGAVVAHFLANNGIRQEEIAQTRESESNQNLTSQFTAGLDLLVDLLQF